MLGGESWRLSDLESFDEVWLAFGGRAAVNLGHGITQPQTVVRPPNTTRMMLLMPLMVSAGVGKDAAGAPAAVSRPEAHACTAHIFI